MDQDIPFDRIGGYRILRRLATGGTSDVLLARAEGPHGFERTVVLKLLLQQFRRDAPMEKMFAREAAAYARLSHPAIVKLYDFFSAEGQLVMVLEFIDGLPLNRFRAMLRKNGDQIDDRASIFIASRIFASLAAAHGARDPESGEFAPVIHRDVNPSNILIPWDGHVKLADFGIAKVAGVASDTQAGFIKGTYGYMAPEQVRGDPVTIRTDVYAASLLLWELLARRKAIQRGALAELEVLRAMAEPSLPSLNFLRPDLPQRLRDSVARGLEPSPDSRSITAEEMLMVLRESVTSNEGRNVLAEMLARVRREVEASRSLPPAAASADSTSKVPAQPGAPPLAIAAPAATPPAPPAAPPRPAPRPQPDVPLRSTLAMGSGPGAMGGQGAPAQGGVILGRVVPPSSRTGAAGKGAPPGIRQMATLGVGLLREEPLGAYSAVSTAEHPISEERTTRLGVAPAPSPRRPPAELSPSAAGTESARGASQEAVIAPEGEASSQPGAIQLIGQRVVSINSPPLDATPDVASSRPSPIIAVGEDGADAPNTLPMPEPVADLPALVAPGPPPELPRIVTPPPEPPLYTRPSPLPSARPIAAMLASTIPSNLPAAWPMTPLPPSPAPVLTPVPPASPPTPQGTRAGAYWLVAALALVASALVVGALIYSQRSPRDEASRRETAPLPGARDPAATVQTTTITRPPAPTAASAAAEASVSAPPPTPSATASAPAARGAPASAPASGATSSATATLESTPTPAPPGSAPAPALTDGQIITPPKAAGHRVFVDTRYAGDSPGPIRVRCGTHTVQVGSSGTPRSVDVPCGGEVSVAPH